MAQLPLKIINVMLFYNTGKIWYLGKLHNVTMPPTHFNPKSAWYAHPAIMLKHIWKELRNVVLMMPQKARLVPNHHSSFQNTTYAGPSAGELHAQCTCFPSSAYNVNFQSKMREYKVSKWSNSPHPVPLRSYSRRKAGLGRVPSGPRLVYRPLGCSSEWENDSRERCQPPTAWLPSLERLRTGHSHQNKQNTQYKRRNLMLKRRRRDGKWASDTGGEGAAGNQVSLIKNSHAFPPGLVRSCSVPRSPLM